jgi:hypothetical protein
MEDKKQLIENIAECIRNARVELEQGGKYDWNSDLQSCDSWLKLVLKKLNEWE